MATLLCQISEFAFRPSKGFKVNGHALFVIRQGESYFAYLNNCPHQHIPLDWDNDLFLDHDGELIQCSSHGALFVIETGACVAGPCVGENLTQLNIEIADEAIYLIDEL